MGIAKVIYGNNTLVDLTNDSVTAANLLNGVTAHAANGNPITGTYNPIDLSNDTVTPETLLNGYTAHNANGVPIVGTATAGGGGNLPSNNYYRYHFECDGMYPITSVYTLSSSGSQPVNIYIDTSKDFGDLNGYYFISSYSEKGNFLSNDSKIAFGPNINGLGTFFYGNYGLAGEINCMNCSNLYNLPTFAGSTTRKFNDVQVHINSTLSEAVMSSSFMNGISPYNFFADFYNTSINFAASYFIANSYLTGIELRNLRLLRGTASIYNSTIYANSNIYVNCQNTSATKIFGLTNVNMRNSSGSDIYMNLYLSAPQSLFGNYSGLSTIITSPGTYTYQKSTINIYLDKNISISDAFYIANVGKQNPIPNVHLFVRTNIPTEGPRYTNRSFFENLSIRNLHIHTNDQGVEWFIRYGSQHYIGYQNNSVTTFVPFNFIQNGSYYQHTDTTNSINVYLYNDY